VQGPSVEFGAHRLVGLDVRELLAGTGVGLGQAVPSGPQLHHPDPSCAPGSNRHRPAALPDRGEIHGWRRTLVHPRRATASVSALDAVRETPHLEVEATARSAKIRRGCQRHGQLGRRTIRHDERLDEHDIAQLDR